MYKFGVIIILIFSIFINPTKVGAMPSSDGFVLAVNIIGIACLCGVFVGAGQGWNYGAGNNVVELVLGANLGLAYYGLCTAIPALLIGITYDAVTSKK
ncbi:MAG: hypothetical protein KKA19_08255 [Candidatus Margulisbacteria bacterium]|nr:hypothetical protein [Candidatus Margulisiibacteriota bacterium]